MADSAAFRRAPGSILLDRTVYFADRPNGTTAGAFSPAAGHAVEVTFRLAARPARSYLCLRFPGRDGNAAAGPVDAAVVCSEKDMAVVELQFRWHGRREYFVYKADPNHPSLDLLPPPYDASYSPQLGLLPGGAGGGYHIAALRHAPPLPQGSSEKSSDYLLYVFSSKTRAWSVTGVRSPWPTPPPGSSSSHTGGEDAAPPPPPPHQTHKVIALGDSTVGFVDFRSGILCYDIILDAAAGSPPSPEPPPPRYIRFPPPVGSNGNLLENCAASIRDAACVDDGVIKFVEVENISRIVVVRGIKKSIPDVLSDSDLEKLSATATATATTSSRSTRDVFDGARDSFSWANDGWRMVTWRRQVSNSDHWIKCCDACADDIVVVGNKRLLDRLPPELLRTGNNNGGGGSGSEVTLNKNHVAGGPALSAHEGDDVVYLKCKLELADRAGWLLGIDTRKKRVEGVASVSSSSARSQQMSHYIPCTISKYMSMSPHVCKGSGCCKDVEGGGGDAGTSRVPPTFYPESHATPRNSAPLSTTNFASSCYVSAPS